MPKSTSQHIIARLVALDQASCCSAAKIHHTDHTQTLTVCAPHLPPFAPAARWISWAPLLPPQGGPTPPFAIAEQQLSIRAVRRCKKERMLAQCLDFDRFSPPSLAPTRGLCSIVHSNARTCVLEHTAMECLFPAGIWRSWCAAGRCAKVRVCVRVSSKGGVFSERSFSFAVSR